MLNRKVVLPPTELILPRRQLLFMGLGIGVRAIAIPTVLRAGISLAAMSTTGVVAGGCGSSSGGGGSVGGGGGGTQTKTLEAALRAAGYVITPGSSGTEPGLYISLLSGPTTISNPQFEVQGVYIGRDAGTFIVRTGEVVSIGNNASIVGGLWRLSSILDTFVVS